MWGLVFLSGVLLAGLVCALCFKKSKIDRNTLHYIFAFSNYGFFGYPVIEGVFGQEVLAKTIIFAIPCSIAINSIGYYLLMGKGKSFRQIILSPNILSVGIGCAIGLLGFGIPFKSEEITLTSTLLGFISDSISTAGACMSAITMLLTGLVLGSFPLKELFKSPLAYLISFVRLAVIASCCFLLLYFVGVRGILFAIPIIICAMPVGMNTILFTEAGGRDSSENARICFISNVMGLLTIPVVFAVVSNFI